MYRALLRAQWPATAPLLIIATLLTFAMPFLQLSAGIAFNSVGDPGDASAIIASQVSLAPLYPLLAWFIGLLMAAATWRDDSTGKHIYALSLPVPRWYYLLLRLSTGLTYLVVPTVAMGVAALIVSSQVTLPPGLHAYPGGLMVRFALASAVGFSTLFALGSANERTIQRGAIAAIVVVAIVVGIGIAGAGPLGFDEGLEGVLKSLVRWPSFVDAFLGRWLLFDV